MQVDGVRHHGRAHHARGEQHALRSLEPRYQPAGDITPVDRAHEQARDESDGDDEEQTHRHVFEGALAVPRLHGQQDQRNTADDQSAQQQRKVEQELERDRAAHHFCEVRCGGDQLGLHPEQDAPDARKPVAEQLRKAASGDERQLRRQVLNDGRHEVGQHEDPDEEISEAGAGRDVRSDIAWVDVRDRCDECRPD